MALQRAPIIKTRQQQIIFNSGSRLDYCVNREKQQRNFYSQFSNIFSWLLEAFARLGYCIFKKK